MVVLGSIVGRQIAIRPKRVDDWQVVPNLWGGIVGRPSLLKSPALQEILRPLAPMEAKAKEEHEEALQDYEARQLVSAAKKKTPKTI
jgi:putative DNA primase/helicase